MATTVAKNKPASVPALVNTPSLEIDSSDVVFSKVYIGHPQSKAGGGEMKMGQIFVAAGEDDPDPALLWDPKADEKKPGVLFHVLGMRKGRSLSEDGDLQTWAFNDPNAHPDSWVTYNYVLCLPEHDDTSPFKMLLTRSKTAAAKQINTVLQKNAGRGPAWNCAFRMTTQPRSNDKGKWAVPRITVVEAEQANIDAAAALAGMVGDPSVTEAPTPTATDEPAI